MGGSRGWDRKSNVLAHQGGGMGGVSPSHGGDFPEAWVNINVFVHYTI